MSSLMPLRRRIKAIKSTQKLTHAMRLVAITSHSKQKGGHDAAKIHRKKIESILFQLTKAHPQCKDPFLTPEDPTNANPLVIIISPVRGMCGSFRNNLVRYAEKKLQFEYYQSPTFVTIGSRAEHIAKASIGSSAEKDPHIALHFPEISFNSAETISRKIIDQIYKRNNSHFSQITCLGGTFVNLFSQKPKMQTITPLQDKHGNLDNNKAPIKYIWEQSEQTILKEVAKHYIQIAIQQAIYESLFAEDSARFIAMDTATTNAEKHLETMMFEYNKIRQTSITQEVTELSSAM